MKSFAKTATRAVAALFAVALVTLGGVCTPAFADGVTSSITNARTGNVYNDLAKATAEAKSGDTIELGEGNYTLYGVDSKDTTQGKDLTFEGLGTDKTAWNIGAPVPDPAHFGTEYNGDYSFDGAGTVTFKNMTLRSGIAKNNNYLGFIRADKTVVDSCVINNQTCYWGYTCAEFKNTTFNAPSGDYAIWTYSSPTMTFENCTFNASGKMIKVYTDYSAGKHDITVNVKNCTFNSKSSKWDILGYYKQALSIDDSNMGNFKYILNITNSSATAQRDKTTCSQLFGFGGKEKQYNTSRTDVTIDGVTVWSNGQKLTHSYTDGEHDDNFKDEKKYDWEKKPDGWYCTGHAKCVYCGYEIAETVKATSVDTATCTEKGTRTYTATFSHKCFKPQTKTEEIAALGHDWGEPEYSWAEKDGGWCCTAKRVCKRDASHVEEEAVQASAKNTPATCTGAGEDVYTATFSNEAFEAQTKTEALDPLGHDWGELVYTWAEKDGEWHCTAKRVCKRDASHVEQQTVQASVETAPATCLEEGKSVYTATFDGDVFKPQTKTEALNPLGHDWGEPVYTWAKKDGDWYCTAKHVCKRDASHVEEETVKAAYEVTTPATTTKEGEGTYTATFKNEAFQTQTKTEPIAKLPVKPQEPAKPKPGKPGKSDKTNKQTLPGTGDSTASAIMVILSMAIVCFAASVVVAKVRK